MMIIGALIKKTILSREKIYTENVNNLLKGRSVIVFLYLFSENYFTNQFKSQHIFIVFSLALKLSFEYIFTF